MRLDHPRIFPYIWQYSRPELAAASAGHYKADMQRRVSVRLLVFVLVDTIVVYLYNHRTNTNRWVVA